MKIQMSKLNWKTGVTLAIAVTILFGMTAKAVSSSFTYPINRHVTGIVMSVTLPLGKGEDGEIKVNEKTYRVSPNTVLVTLNSKTARLDYFKPGNQVYMIVNIYERYNEALYISPVAQN